MQDKTSVFLAEGIVIGCGLILVAVLVIVFSPLLWSDHVVTFPMARTLSGCSIQPTGDAGVYVAHCPFWTNTQALAPRS